MAEPFTGEPGGVWTNTTEKVFWQFHCDWVNTCGVCAEMDGMVSAEPWPIPIHINCRCFQSSLFPGDTSQPFTDFLETIKSLPAVEQTKVLGKALWKLVASGVISFTDAVTAGRVKTLAEVVRGERIGPKTLAAAGVDKRTADEALKAAAGPPQPPKAGLLKAIRDKIASNKLFRRVFGKPGPAAAEPPKPSPLSPAELGKALGLKLKSLAGAVRDRLRPPAPAPAPPPPPPAPKPKPSIPFTDAKLKERVEHAKFIEDEHAAVLKTLAEAEGTTPGAVKAVLDAGVKAAVDSGEFYLRVDGSVLPKVLADGRFKTQFEVAASGGAYDPGVRSAIEAEQFGTPPGTAPKDRPIYGYVSRPGFASVGTQAENRVEGYGDVAVRLKPGVRGRATVTVSDSLAWGERLQGVPASAPTSTALPMTRTNFPKAFESLKGETDPGKWLDTFGERFAYTEAQYHGGLSVDDVAEVAFPAAPDPDVAAALEARGIPWRVTPR